MGKPVVAFINSHTIRIDYPRLFRENVLRSRARFLERSFEVEDVLSIEIAERRGWGFVHLRRKLHLSVPDVLARLAERLVEPVEAEPGRTVARYFELKHEDGLISYARVPRQATGIGRWAYQGLGYTFLSLSVIGIASPFVPTTPFILLSSYFFVRSSPKLNARLLHSRMFGASGVSTSLS